ncbi:MAG: hypothetical protein ACRDPA_22205, partial [Solirubrobacteraceae bacterium]
MQRTQSPEHNSSFTSPWRSARLFAVRYRIGGVAVLAGILVLVLVIVPGEIGATGMAWVIGVGLSLLLLNAGLTVLLLSLLVRFGAGGQRGLAVKLAKDECKRRPAARCRVRQSIPETR